MKKIQLVFIVLLLSSCSISLGPTAKLTQKNAIPTSTPTIVQVRHSVASPTVETTCTVTGDLHLRVAPSADAKIVDWLINGESVVANGTENAGWRAVRNWAGVSGYVNVRWLDCGGAR